MLEFWEICFELGVVDSPRPLLPLAEQVSVV